MKAKFLPVIAALILGFITCTEPCPEKINHADFTMSAGGVVADTFFSNTTIEFKANQTNALSYAWSFPNGQNTSDKATFSLGIRNNFGNTIPIQLIVKYKPDKKCFPNDDGIDTLQKSFYIVEYDKEAAWVGIFRGHNEDKPNHTFEIIIKFIPELTDSMKYVCNICCLGRCYTGFRIFNLPEDCGGGRTDIFIPVPTITEVHSYYNFDFGLNFSGGNCKSSNGRGVLTRYRDIRIEYWYTEDNINTIKKVFVGKKIK
jgi:hypothetical protein